MDAKKRKQISEDEDFQTSDITVLKVFLSDSDKDAKKLLEDDEPQFVMKPDYDDDDDDGNGEDEERKVSNVFNTDDDEEDDDDDDDDEDDELDQDDYFMNFLDEVLFFEDVYLNWIIGRS